MRRTLFLIPHEVAGIPVIGFGWLLILLGIGLAVRLVVAGKSGQSLGGVLTSEGYIWGIMAVVIAYVMPGVELKNVDGEPVGMAIRGYGVMLLGGVASAIGLAAIRTKNRGLNPDVIYSLAPWVFVGGIVGARLFYVIQYRDKFIGDSIGQTLRNIVAFTEGGLVVYGSFIGGTLAALIFFRLYRQPVWKLGDAIVPCMFLGVFLGRIGCLMNGCCYGGRCEEGWSSLQFPPGSPVYQEQLFDGELLGLRVNSESSRIDEVTPGSLADEAGIQPGSRLGPIVLDDSALQTAPRDIPEEDARLGVLAVIDQQTYRWSPQQLPPRALPVQAAQLISSGSALVLCLILCALSAVIRRDGAVMMLGFAGYAVLRFVLELVRVDEGGQFGTALSISQWVSVGVFAGATAGLVWLYWQPPLADASLHEGGVES